MQVDTSKPAGIKDTTTGEFWFLMRADNRYHRRADDVGRWPSDFFTEFNRLRPQFRAI